MKRGYLILILVISLIIISACGKLEWERLSCTEGETRCSSSHDSIIQCSGNKWNVIQNCADPNPVCKVVNGTPQCTTNSAPVVNAGNDFSVSGNNGAILGATWTNGKIGKALVFDGLNDYMEVPDSPTLDFKDKVTISAWVNLDYAGNTWDLIAMKEGTGERAFGMWVNENTNEILLSYHDKDLIAHSFQVSAGFNYLEWNHIVGVIDTEDNYMEVYLNNVRYRSTGAADLPPMKLNDFPLYFIRDGFDYASGAIDEIAILNDALTADEVNQAYQSYQSGVRPGLDIERLQLYYALDEGTGTTAFDSSNNIGKTVTLSGSATDSDNDKLTFSWSVVSAPVTNFKYGDQKTLNPWFVPTQSGVYTFRLNVNDGVITTSDDINIIIGGNITTCSDGTPYNSCSATKPLFCDNGNLVNNCQNCGCNSGGICQTDGSCLLDTTRAYFPNDQTPWGIEKIYNDPNVASTSGGLNVDVAVLDTGVYKEHLDLKNKAKQCKDFTKGPIIKNGCDDGNGHGTHVSGTILADAGDDKKGIYGVAPEANLFAYKVCGSGGSCWSDDIATGIRYAADQGAEIISMSLGGDTESSLIRDAIDYATNKGVLIIAAAGNDGPANGSIDYPGANAKVIAVGAIDVNEQVSNWSSRGLNNGDYIIEEKEVEFAAPGVSVESAWPTGYYTISGTSMATPHVSGLAAKFWQGNAADTRNYLRSLARDIWTTGDDTATGFGLPTV